MIGRTVIGVMLASLVAGIGFMMMPRRRNRFSLNAFRWLLASRRGMNRWGRMLMRTAAR